MDEDVVEERTRFSFSQGLAVGLGAGVLLASTVDLLLTWLILCVRFGAAVCG